MIRYEAIQPEMSETLRAIGKTNEERAHEMALVWMDQLAFMDAGEEGVTLFYKHYDMAYRYFLKKLEARDEK